VQKLAGVGRLDLKARSYKRLITMAITTSFLLSFETDLPALPHVTEVRRLEDGLVLHTDLDFGEDPDVLAGLLRGVLGEELSEQHKDVRGLFLIPSAAAPSANTYDGVIEEVGEGGVWVFWSLPYYDHAAIENFSALLDQLPADFARGLGDPSVLRAASAQLPQLLNDPDALTQLTETAHQAVPGLDEMLQSLGIGLASPELKELTQNFVAELERDPAKFAALAESLFGGGDEEGDEDDEEGDA